MKKRRHRIDVSKIKCIKNIYCCREQSTLNSELSRYSCWEQVTSKKRNCKKLCLKMKKYHDKHHQQTRRELKFRKNLINSATLNSTWSSWKRKIFKFQLNLLLLLLLKQTKWLNKNISFGENGKNEKLFLFLTRLSNP